MALFEGNKRVGKMTIPEEAPVCTVCKKPVITGCSCTHYYQKCPTCGWASGFYKNPDKKFPPLEGKELEDKKAELRLTHPFLIPS